VEIMGLMKDIIDEFKFNNYLDFDKKIKIHHKRTIHELLIGMITSRSVLLTEIARKLKIKGTIKHIHKRLDRNLKELELGELEEKLIYQNAAAIEEMDLCILDMSDIAKPYASKMEYLGTVHDGSAKKEVSGFPMMGIVSINPSEKSKQFPVANYLKIFSRKAPGYMSDNDEIEKAISAISANKQQRLTWVIDRGGDSNAIFNMILRQEDNFIIRMDTGLSSRGIILDSKHEEWNISQLDFSKLSKTTGSHITIEKLLPCVKYLPEQVKLTGKIEKNDEIEKKYSFECAFFYVKLPGIEKKFLDRTFGLYIFNDKKYKTPIGIISTILPEEKQILANMKKIIHSYVYRWVIEEYFRFLKQSFDLENIRILTYQRMQNMIKLLFFVSTILWKISFKTEYSIWKKHIAAVIEYAKPSLKTIKSENFIGYAMVTGLANLFSRNPLLLYRFGFLPLRVDSFDNKKRQNKEEQLFLIKPKQCKIFSHYGYSHVRRKKYALYIGA